MPRPTHAFSMIEVMLVVAIVGILAALSMVSLSGTVRAERARGEAIKAVDAVERARNRARVQVCEIHVDVSAAASTITIGPNPADADANCVALPTEVVRLNPSLITISQFTISNVATNPLRLNTDGGFTSTSRALMALALSTGTVRTVELWPAVGTVRLK